jgi:hypothetical protein
LSVNCDNIIEQIIIATAHPTDLLKKGNPEAKSLRICVRQYGINDDGDDALFPELAGKPWVLGVLTEGGEFLESHGLAYAEFETRAEAMDAAAARLEYLLSTSSKGPEGFWRFAPAVDGDEMVDG